MGEEQHERLGRTVDRHAELRCQAHHRTDVDDRAFACFGQARGDGAGEPHQRRGVEGNQLRNAVGALVDEVTGQRGAGVIDEDADTGVVAQTAFNGCQITELGQVRRNDIDGDVVFAAQAGCKCVQACLVSGNQYEIVAALREAFGVDGANAGGGASDENSRAGTHGVISLSEWVKTKERGH
ncbi:hypothetical protein EMIT0373P_11618 [Pseudomonas chlororaphis]